MLIIGYVNFFDLAAPEYWPFGGELKIPIREIPGGSIYYQPRGYFPTLEHSWEGSFNNTDALIKTELVEGYMKQADSVEVTFHNFKLYYFVEKFTWKFVRPDWVDFSITLRRDLSKEDVMSDGKKELAAIERAYAIAAGQQPADQIVHTVNSGEYLVMLGEKYGIPWEDIYLQNRATIGIDPDVIIPGTKLVINV